MNERFKQGRYNTNINSHIHLSNGDIVFTDDLFSINNLRKLTRVEFELIDR